MSDRAGMPASYDTDISREPDAGKSVWQHKINLTSVFHNDDLTFEQSRDAIVARIRATTWFKAKSDFADLVFLVDELGDSETQAAFNAVWDEIYDIADYDRVWITTS